MSDQRREKQVLQLAAQHLAEQNGKAPLPPEAQQVLAMDPTARQCIFFVDLLRNMLAGMVNQIGLVGGVRFVPAFMQLMHGLESFRRQVMQAEGSPIVIAKPGDVPPIPQG